MTVIVASSAGFCRGVKKAVEKARALRRRSRCVLFTDGPLIHNDQMMEELRREGIREAPDPFRLRRGTLLVRAHGISPERRALLRRLPVHLADATCPDVARIQGIIRRHAARGYQTILFGDPGHAEVVGLLGCAQGRGHVVTGPSDVRRLRIRGPVCLVAQSTQFPEGYRRVAAAVQRHFPQAVVLDTICEATRNRQAEVLALAEKVDAFVVVGGRHSANTRRLMELARSLKPTFPVEESRQLRARDFRHVRTVGLTAGASTPDFIIERVRRRLLSMPGAGPVASRRACRRGARPRVRAGG